MGSGLNAEYMGTHPIFESDFDCLTEFKMSQIDREELSKMLDQFKKGKKSNFGLSNIFSQLNEVCEMQTQLHQKHYNINKITEKDNPSSDDLKNDLAEIPAVNEIFYEMKILSDKITALPDNIG